jgi:hypothetical protein
MLAAHEDDEPHLLGFRVRGLRARVLQQQQWPEFVFRVGGDRRLQRLCAIELQRRPRWRERGL